MELTQIYQETIRTWGEEAQYDQMIEECAELIVALKHFKRSKIAKQDVINEIADVTMMIGQLTWMVGEENVHAAVEQKIKKLEDLLNSQSTLLSR